MRFLSPVFFIFFIICWNFQMVNETSEPEELTLKEISVTILLHIGVELKIKQSISRFGGTQDFVKPLFLLFA